MIIYFQPRRTFGRQTSAHKPRARRPGARCQARAAQRPSAPAPERRLAPDRGPTPAWRPPGM